MKYFIKSEKDLKTFYTPDLRFLNVKEIFPFTNDYFSKSIEILKESMIFYSIFGTEDCWEKDYYHYSKYKHGINSESNFKGLKYSYLENNLDLNIFREELDEYIIREKEIFLHGIELEFKHHDSEIRFKVFLKEQIEALKSAYLYADKINIKELNFIDREVLELLIPSYKDTYLGLKEKYIDIIPNCFDLNIIPLEKTRSRKDILIGLIGKETTKEYIQFENYEKKLVPNHLNDSRNEWLKGLADFIRFYNHCEGKGVFQSHYKENSKGVKLLRELYNIDNASLDTPFKRKKQNTEKTKFDYNFLDVI